MLYSGFNILHRSVFWSADFNGRSDNTDVIVLAMNTIQFPRLFLSAILLFAVAGCGPVNEDHFAEIGGAYSLEKFTLTFNGGKLYSFNETEREALAQEWNNGNVPFASINNIVQKGTPLKYHIVFSDQYETGFDGSIATIGGSHYLYLGLLGDAGGFPGDVIPHVIKLDDVMEDEAIDKLFELAKQILEEIE